VGRIAGAPEGLAPLAAEETGQLVPTIPPALVLALVAFVGLAWRRRE
jgi:hypothetical protein